MSMLRNALTSSRRGRKNPSISAPENPLHLHHVSIDRNTGLFSGLPKEWLSMSEGELDPGVLAQPSAGHSSSESLTLIKDAPRTPPLPHVVVNSPTMLSGPVQAPEDDRSAVSRVEPLLPEVPDFMLKRSPKLVSTTSWQPIPTTRLSEFNKSQEKFNQVGKLYNGKTIAADYNYTEGAARLEQSAQHMRDLIDECGWNLGHQEFLDLQRKLLTVVSPLGSGSIGVVDEVRVSKSNRTFVRKRVQLHFSTRQQQLKIIRHEAKVLEMLVHSHIVKFIGSYHDGIQDTKQFYSILMFPVGDRDLKTFLDMTGHESLNAHGETNPLSTRWLQKWFKCLASALAYMHKQGIRHQDIKPSNIIHCQDQIYFTDFSSAGRFQVDHTTSTENPARSTAMYSAPEVIQRGDMYNRHGRGTDVFALGVVFCEMLTVCYGRTVNQFQEFFQASPRHPIRCVSGSGADAARPFLFYAQDTTRIHEWFGDDTFYNSCVRPMLAEKREDRPLAADVARQIREFRQWESFPCTCDLEVKPSTPDLRGGSWGY